MYKFKMRARPREVKEGRGRDVAYDIHENVKAAVLKHSSSSVEQFWLRVNVNGFRLAVGTVYRSPWQAVNLK